MIKGDILSIDLGNPPGGSGREQSGIRPAIAISLGDADQSNPMITVVPLTGSISATRFPHTLSINPTQQNGLSVESIAMAFQLRSIDKRRVLSIRGHLESDVLSDIDLLISNLLSL